MVRRFAIGASLLVAIFFGASAGASAQLVFRSGNIFHVQACPGPVARGFARCHAHIVSDSLGRVLTFARPFQGGGAPSGYGPAQLRSAYGITGSGSPLTVVAVVDAYGYPNAASDLAVYRSTFGLPPCGTGCFAKYNEQGGSSYPSSNTGWDQEQALDLDMVSAMCPSCKIILVEASSASYGDLATAENEAALLGAHSIGNSYGGSESGSQSYEPAYNHLGIAITASTGDSGYAAGPQFPATSPHVTAVGGTTLTTASNSRGWAETAWSGGGSGCSQIYGQPTWQTPVDSFCPNRTEADVSADANPSTGVAVYGPTGSGGFRRSNSGWLVFGGTSVSAQIISGIYGVNGGAVNYGQNPYGDVGALFDVTSGNNGTCGGSPICTAGPGYDGPTGLGTPNGPGAF